MASRYGEGPIEPVTEAFLRAHDGRRIDLLDPSKFDPDLHFLAKSLSNICRFGGHVERFYSVASHSVLVSLIVPPRLARAALLHDAQEGILGADICSPLKSLLPDWKALESRWADRIGEFYGARCDVTEIKAADRMAFYVERFCIQPKACVEATLHPGSWDLAEDAPPISPTAIDQCTALLESGRDDGGEADFIRRARELEIA